MQAGLFYGAVDMVDGILSRMKETLGAETHVVATGGQASLVARASRHIQSTDEFLTLDGLRILWERNSDSRRGAGRNPSARSDSKEIPGKANAPAGAEREKKASPHILRRTR
jgi:hypothetical protein